MAIPEFELIARYFTSLGAERRGVSLDVGDDCALLDVPEGQQLAVSLDTLVSGIHFPEDTPSDQIARRALAACLSDLAAMGAEPVWITLGLSLPDADPAWLEPFSRALAEGCRHYGVSLVGGDTTRGPLVITLQVHGWVPKGEALRRDGARPGDRIFVTGTLGDAMAGLDQITEKEHPDPFLRDRFYAPSARVDTGLMLRAFASSAVDISDGFLADLDHLLERSGCGAFLELHRLPLSEAIREHYPLSQAQTWAQSGGEDYELCFTVPEAKLAAFEEALKHHQVTCTRVGRIEAKAGMRAEGPGDAPVTVEPRGYRHF